MDKGKDQIKVVGRNKKAQFKYHILTRYEAGMVLTGSEVKSLRAGTVGFEDAYAFIKDGELWLRSLHIAPYAWARGGGHNPDGDRKLLLKKSEIRKISHRIKEKGLTLIPTQVYFKNGWAKVEVALAEGKRQYDKRQAIKERETKRELDRFKKMRKGAIGRRGK